MPRGERKLSDSKIYHIIVRGNEKKEIFHNNNDRERFLDILKAKQSEKTYSYLAYCLMSNHVHLILDIGEENISRIMQRINISYAQFFNKKYSRVGHLFQDRFRSEGIEKDDYLLAAIRYVHNNPVKAGLVQHPEEYSWSSYGEFASKVPVRRLVNKNKILGLFDQDLLAAVEIFKDFSISGKEDQIIDIMEDNMKAREKERAEFVMKKFLEHHGMENSCIKTFDKTLRDQLIVELKNKTNISIRELAEMLEINRNTIQRKK